MNVHFKDPGAVCDAKCTLRTRVMFNVGLAEVLVRPWEYPVNSSCANSTTLEYQELEEGQKGYWRTIRHLSHKTKLVIHDVERKVALEPTDN